MNEAAPAIVHEAEVQRQHVRLKLPLNVQVGSRQYAVGDWSNAGFAIVGFSLDLGIGKTAKGQLLFPAEGFTLALDIEFEIRNISREEGRVGCRFINLSGHQLATLQYLVSAYMTGELVQVGDIIDVAARNNFTTARKVPSQTEGMSWRQRAIHAQKRALGFSLLALLSVALIAYIGASIFERVFIVTAESAVAKSDTIVIEAPRAGLLFVNASARAEQVRSGEPLFAIKTDLGKTITIDSPCDCLLEGDRLAGQRWVRAGEKIMNLIPQSQPLRVEAVVSYQEALRLQPGQMAFIAAPAWGGGNRQGRVVEIRALGDGDPRAWVRIEPGTPLPASLAGIPLAVRIDTLGLGTARQWLDRTWWQAEPLKDAAAQTGEALQQQGQGRQP